MTLYELDPKIREIMSNTTVADDQDIPFANYEEFRRLEKEGRLSIASRYDGYLVEMLGTKSDLFMHFLLMNVPFIICIVCIVLAVITLDYRFALGIVFAFAGWFFSSPAMLRCIGGVLLVITFAFFGIACYQHKWIAATLLGASAFSNFFCGVGREQCRGIIHESILLSEPLFVWLYGNHKIFVSMREK